MTNTEIKAQIFKTTQQWQSGLLYRLEPLAEGGVTLFSRPAFVEWLTIAEEIAETASLFIDDCRQVYFIDNNTCQLFRPARAARRWNPGCPPAARRRC